MRNPHSFQERIIGKWRWPFLFLPFVLFLLIFNETHAEGSKDFLLRPGYRMFLDTREDQQMKVYVKTDEFINLGSSHLGIAGGFIKIFRPDGALHATLDGSNGSEGIIYNNFQEANGPIGNGISNVAGYHPWAYKVPAGQDGVWTVLFDFPTYVATNFQNIKNSDPWDRLTHQPNFPRVVLAWDITVSENNAANSGGKTLTGRVFTNEYVSVIDQNGFSTSPLFYVLTKDGFVYKVEFMDADPFRFPISANNLGFVTHDIIPVYRSQPRNMVTRSADPNTWQPGSYYLYEPQAEDYGNGTISNNKIFFNTPKDDLPKWALSTDIFTGDSHQTWLSNVPTSYTVQISNFEIMGSPDGTPCGAGVIGSGETAYLSFESTVSGTASLALDINNDGDFTDSVDRVIYQYVQVGANELVWDGKDGLGNPLPISNAFSIGYLLKVRGGETHILLTDVENNEGGVTFDLVRYNQPGIPTDIFYYDHSLIGGGISGGLLTGEPQATNVPYTYDSNFGNNRILDYWAFFDYDGEGSGTLVFEVVDDCGDDGGGGGPEAPIVDGDGDGVNDTDDLDDDNDGVPDRMEYCNPAGGYGCLPSLLDPTGDKDTDGIPNYMDADDPSYPNGCDDANNDGICDKLLPVFDKDGDGVPDHLDLDSDNDGISDLVEAGHGQPDANGDGLIDGDASMFGLNGLFNAIASDPDDFNAVETYARADTDGDGVPDHDDLDSDNDGIHDVAEAGYSDSDSNNDGRIDDGTGQPPSVNAVGLAPIIDPAITGNGIPLPPDKDGDGVPDWHDLDSDNDLIHDVVEGGNTDPDNDAIIGGGLPAVNENGLAAGATSVPMDTDGDQVPDFHDLDSDNDGINDVREANGIDQNNDGLPGIGPIIVDGRGRPIGSTGYAHTTTSHPQDTDDDQVPDYRDLDSDNDNIYDVAEANKPDPDNNGRVSTGIPAVDADGRSTAEIPTSFPTDTDNDGHPDFRERDSDDDGINDITEANKPDPDYDGVVGSGVPSVDQNGVATFSLSTSKPTDSDGNGNPDFQQIDSDADGILDKEECPNGAPCRDWDNDLTDDFQDPDRDNDGISDSYECETGFPCPDTDGDLIPDVDDLDTDGDNLSDANECPGGEPCPDANNNSVPEWREYSCNPSIVLPLANNVQPFNPVFCEGGDVMLNAFSSIDVLGDSVTYQWVGPNSFDFTSTASEFGPFSVDLTNLNASDAGTYTLYLFTENGCPAAPVSVSLSIGGNLQPPTLNIEEDVLCEGQTLELESSISQSGMEYEWWFDNGTGPVSIGVSDVPSFFINDITVANAGLYYVSINAGGCSSSLSNAQVLTIDNVLSGVAPILSIDEDVLCEGHTLELNSTPYPGSGVFYNWLFDNGSGPVSIAITSVPTLFIDSATAVNTGIYSIQILMGNCSSQVSNGQDVLINNDLSYIVPTLSLNQDVVCEGETIELNSNAFPGQGLQYLWWFDDGTGPVLIGFSDVPTYFIPNATLANTGVYSVSVTMGLCESVMSNLQDIEVSTQINGAAPVLSVVDDVLCEGQSLELNSSVFSGNNVTYNWWFDNGNGLVLIATTDIPTLYIDSVDVNNQGVYMVSAARGGCETQRSNAQDITINNAMDMAPQLSINEGLLCEGDLLELNSNAIQGINVQYHWFFDDGNGQVALGTTNVPTFFLNNTTIENTGVYFVSASVGSCATQLSNAQDVEVQPIPFVEIMNTTDPMNVACQGDVIELSVPFIPGASYSWMGPSGFMSNSSSWAISPASNIHAGAYTVTVETDACKFQSDPTQVYVFGQVNTDDDEFQLAAIDSITTADLMANDELGNVVNWQIGLLTSPQHGTVIVDDDNNLVYYPNDGFTGNDIFIYQICNEDCPDACDESVVNIRVYSDNLEREECFVPNIITPNGDGANDQFAVPCLESDFTNNNLKVFNRWGDLVHEAQPYANDWGGTYRNSPLPPGTYFYVLKLDIEEEKCLQGYFTITR